MTDLLTWDSVLNSDPDYSSVAALAKSTLWKLKDLIVSSAGWTVAGSCDASAAGMDSVDRWTGSYVSKLTRAASGAHSWIVLSGFAGAFFMCIDLNGDGDYVPASFVFAKSAFTGGSTTARPTSVDEWVYAAGTYTWLNDNTAANNRMQFVYSTRGDFWFWTHKVAQTSVPAYFAMAVTQVTPLTGVTDTHPVVTYVCSYYPLRYDTIFSPGYVGFGWRGRTATGVLFSGLTCCTITHFAGSSPLQYIPATGGNVTKALPKLPLTIWVWDTSTGHTDYKGMVPDVQAGPWGFTPGAPDSASSPTRRLVGCVWLPGMSTTSPSY